MLLFLISAIIAVAVGIWNTASCTFIINKGNALLCKRLCLFGGGLGLIATTAVLLWYSIKISLYDKDNAQVIKDVFFIYFAVATILFAVCFAIGLASALLKNKMHFFVPLLCGLWSVLILFWTYVCSTWSHFPDLSLYPFILLYGISLCPVLLIPSVPVLSQRHKMLSDSEYVQAILDERKQKKEAKHQKREKAKRTAEKKKRLKDPKKHN